jgi:A/G-specific adenine glycosylase
MVSEVMLQQTQVARVVPAYLRFLATFPTVEALARASRADVVRAWAGLGYNRRAVALSEAARAIVRDHAGGVPSEPEALRRLPGIGPYTAAAVASLGFGVAVAAVDTNVRRVVARARLGCEPDRVAASVIRDEAERWLDRRQPGEWNQALMDLGREVCRVRPRCAVCPLVATCRSLGTGRRPTKAAHRTAPFEGSRRQVRGAIVRAIGGRGSISLGGLAQETGFPIERIVDVVGGLARDGLVAWGPAARAGRPRGRVRLAE